MVKKFCPVLLGVLQRRSRFNPARFWFYSPPVGTEAYWAFLINLLVSLLNLTNGKLYLREVGGRFSNLSLPSRY